MSSLPNLKTGYMDFLKSFPVVGSIPFSFLLIGIEELIEFNISCPCRFELNKGLATAMFVGPPLFAFALLFFALRPFRRKCCPQGFCPKGFCPKGFCPKEYSPEERCPEERCPEERSPEERSPEEKDDKKKNWNCWNAFGHCFIPPVLWIIILFFDGDYLACCLTTWEGNYVFDEELNRKWCEPIEQANAGNQSDLRRQYQGYITISKACGYGILGVLGVLIFIIIGIYDCCLKCAGCKVKDPEAQRILQNVEKGTREVNSPDPNTSSSTAGERHEESST